MTTGGLKIGLIGPLPPPSGGMANQTMQLTRLLRQEGIAVEIVQVNAPYRPRWVGSLRGVRAMFRLAPYFVRLWTTAGRVHLLHVMANSGWAWHLFAAPAVWIGSWRGKPVIVNYRGGEADEFFRRQFRWVRPTLRRAAAVLVPSAFLAAIFDGRQVATCIVPNIIDLSRFFPVERANEFHLIVTRNLEEIYDIPTAIRAFAEVRQQFPDAKMTVAGSGPRLADLQILCDTLGIASAVRFTGRMDNEQVAALYRTADLMLNPSLADNMPNSLLEAMASGVPIISTRVGGIADLVEDGRDALLVPSGDVSAMAGAALRVLRDRDLAQSLARSGIESARRYTWAEVKPQLLSAYARALGVASLSHLRVMTEVGRHE